MSLVIGLTGGIASGKSTASQYIKSIGYKVIDCDKISHDTLIKGNLGYDALISEFGNDILEEDTISRVKLGNIVFNDKEKLNKLNSILHPIIYNEVKSQITNDIVFIDCPLLFETNFIELCDKTLVVYVNEENQIKRLMNRDTLDKQTALNRIKLQLSLEIKKEKCDFLIDNNYSVEYMYEQLDEILKKV